MQIVLFFGAGSSQPFGIPTMKDFPDTIEKNLNSNEAELFQKVKRSLDRFGIRSDLEAVFTVLNDYRAACDPNQLPPAIAYRFADVLSDPIRMAGGMNQETDIENLRMRIQEKIVETCEISGKGEQIFSTFNIFLTRIAECLSKPLEQMLHSHDANFYTTNYDRVLETYFNRAPITFPTLKNLSLQDGTSVDRRHWDVYNYDNSRTMLVPLHGCIDLHTTDSGVIKFPGRPPEVYGEKLTGNLLIFPVRGKYVFQDPFARMLELFKQDLLVSRFAIFVGFSFNDDPIRDILQSVLRRRDQQNKDHDNEFLKVIIVGPDAKKTIAEKFVGYERFVKPVEGPFEEGRSLGGVEVLLRSGW